MEIGKILALVLVLVYVAYVMTGGSQSTYSSFKSGGASGHTAGAGHSDAKIHLSQKGMHHAIKAAGEENGWIMTEYKGNALIAEKVEGDDTVSVTITFDKGSFSIEPANANLKNAINLALH